MIFGDLWDLYESIYHSISYSFLFCCSFLSIYMMRNDMPHPKFIPRIPKFTLFNISLRVAHFRVFLRLFRDFHIRKFILRGGHVPLNAHLKRIGAIADSGCPLCPCAEETVAHHLFVCRQLDDLRTEYLPQNPDIANTLYTNPEQLRNTHKYFVMASGRRARAQWLLDRINK